MNKVTSADGTHIAFDRVPGAGGPVIVVDGALCDRTANRPLAEQLSKRFDVINYDRRGRGDSGDAAPYAVDREIEDLAALIAAAGGTASVYGHSSGAGLALHAAAAGLPITRLVLHEPPFDADPTDAEVWRKNRKDIEHIRDLLAEGRRGDAVEAHLTMSGIPQEMVAGWRGEPWWRRMEASAHTLPHDYEVMGEHSRNGRTPVELARAVSAPTLVLAGGASPEWMIEVARRLADAAPSGRFGLLADQEHVVPPEVLAPVLTEFLAG